MLDKPAQFRNVCGDAGRSRGTSLHIAACFYFCLFGVGARVEVGGGTEYHASSNNALFHRAGRHKQIKMYGVQFWTMFQKYLGAMAPKDCHPFTVYIVRRGLER